MPPRVRDLIKQVEADGWYLVGQRGSHRQYKHRRRRGGSRSPASRAASCTLSWSGASYDRPGC